jgi:hypothetical protein
MELELPVVASSAKRSMLVVDMEVSALSSSRHFWTCWQIADFTGAPLFGIAVVRVQMLGLNCRVAFFPILGNNLSLRAPRVAFF